MYVLQIYQKMCLLILQNGQNDQVGDQVYQQGWGVGGVGAFWSCQIYCQKKIPFVKKKEKKILTGS